jgi:hypothetical protein
MRRDHCIFLTLVVLVLIPITPARAHHSNVAFEVTKIVTVTARSRSFAGPIRTSGCM